MKQTLFMIAVTLFGVVGALAIEPFVGVAVYYFFAVLRPQYLWQWALPASQYGWSGYVAWATLLATGLMLLSGGAGGRPPGSSFAHKAYIVFGAWICLTYVTSLDKFVAWIWFQEYLKIFLMFGVAMLAITRVRQVWQLYLAATGALGYIAYELNFLYFTAGRVDIYRNGYGGLDNNGAALMIAMGVPLAIFAWEATTKWWRWVVLSFVPLMLHAVLMSYSRGAMLSLIVVSPLLLLRTKKRFQFGLVFVVFLALVPVLAGREIRARFFTVQSIDRDESARSRMDSWAAAVKIANDYPIFGVGIRNSNLVSYQYGADMEGRTIHSQYLQTLADSGYVGLGFYLTALMSVWLAILRTRRHLQDATDPEQVLGRSMLSGIEGSMMVFCFGALFLSLEVFELPYLMGLMGAQLSLIMRLRGGLQEAPARAPLADSYFEAHARRAAS